MAASDEGKLGAHSQVLSLLLEMRAELAAVRGRILSRLDRLGQRVGRMERDRANAPELSAVRSNNASMGYGAKLPRRIIGAPARHIRLDDLSPDLLALVAGAIPKDDELAAALTCRKLRSAIDLRRHSDVRTSGTTTELSACVSCAKLAWSVSCGLPLMWRLCHHVVERGQLLQLSWLRSRGCPWDEWICAYAARGGHLAVLQWARANGCPWDEWTCTAAAGGGRLALLQWLHANGCPWDAKVCWWAAEGGHLAVLQWARANSCPWDERTIEGAAAGGHLDVLQCAHANGFPTSTSAK